MEEEQKRGEKRKLAELQKPNVEAETYNNNESQIVLE